METGINKEQLQRYKAVVTAHLSDPAKMRLAVITAMTVIGLLAVYKPLAGRIEDKQQQLAAERRRTGLIASVSALRRQTAAYRPRIGEKSDTNEWVQYILTGLRESAVKLRDMSSRQPRTVGPYKAIVLTVEVEGNYRTIKDLMEWLEQSDRLLRVDSMRCEKQPGSIGMKVILLGLVGKHVSAS